MFCKKMPKEIQFVKEVEKHECLYNSNLPEYNHKHVVDRAWKEVSQNTNLSVPDCKEKWRNIRSSFLRSMKVGKKPKKPYYLSPYIQFVVPYIKLKQSEVSDEVHNSEIQMAEYNENADDTTQYLSVKMERDTDDDTPFEQVDIEVDQDTNMTSENDSLRSSPAEDALSYRRRRSLASRRGSNRRKQTDSLVTNNSIGLNNTSMRYFLLSLLPDFENMSNDQIRLFKVKVMMLIDDIKTNSAEVKRTISTCTEAEKLQKRLINLLIKNLKKKT